MRRRTRYENQRFASKGIRSAEIGSAVSSVQPDRGLLRRGKSSGGEPLPSPVPSAGRIDHQVGLDRSRVGAADAPNSTIATYQFSNRCPILNPDVRGCRCAPANDKFKESTTGAISFQAGIKWCSHRTSLVVSLAVGSVPDSIATHSDSGRTEQPEIFCERRIQRRNGPQPPNSATRGGDGPAEPTCERPGDPRSCLGREPQPGRNIQIARARLSGRRCCRRRPLRAVPVFWPSIDDRRLSRNFRNTLRIACLNLNNTSGQVDRE